MRTLCCCGGIYLLARVFVGERRCHGRTYWPWRSYLQWLAWPRCPALLTILSHLSICYFYFKFKQGLVFPKAYLLFLTRLDGLRPATNLAPLLLQFSLLPGSVAFVPSSHWLHQQQGLMCPSTRQVYLTINEICKVTSTSIPCFNEIYLFYGSFKFSNTVFIKMEIYFIKNRDIFSRSRDRAQHLGKNLYFYLKLDVCFLSLLEHPFLRCN